MHSINLILTVSDGHQEFLDQIAQLLSARNIKICSQTECQISTTIVAMTDGDNPAASEIEDASINAVVAAPELVQQEPIQEPPQPVDTFPKTCKIMHLSTTSEIPIKKDETAFSSSLHVKNLHVLNGLAMFEYCGNFYKSECKTQTDLNRYINVNYILCTIACGDLMIRCAVELVNSDECCLVAGRDLISQMS